MIIGLMGAKGAGKDTVGEILLSEWAETGDNGRRYAFADRLKSMAYVLNPVIDAVTDYGVHWRLADMVDRKGWDVVKQVPDVRRFLQRLGTEAVRDHLGQNIWVDALMNDIGDDLAHDDIANVVITDVRFLNEIQAIRNHGGEIWRIDRETVEDGDQHPSEREWRDTKPDRVILNDGSKAMLRFRIHDALYLNLVRSPNS